MLQHTIYSWSLLCADVLSPYMFAGGHLNPAVTFALCLLGRERWRKFPMYFLFQTIGAFFGAAVIFGMYYGKEWLRVSYLKKLCCYNQINQIYVWSFRNPESLIWISCLHQKCFVQYFVVCFYADALWDYPGAFNVTGPNATAGIFATYPGKHLTIVNGFFDQVLFWHYAQNRNFTIMIIYLI